TADVVRLDAAIDLQPDIAAAGVYAPTRLGQLAQRAVYERLAAKAGVHAHDEHQVDLVDEPVQHVQRRGRVEDQPHLAARLPDRLHAAVRMNDRVGVEADRR